MISQFLRLLEHTLRANHASNWQASIRMLEVVGAPLEAKQTHKAAARPKTYKKRGKFPHIARGYNTTPLDAKTVTYQMQQKQEQLT